MLKGKLTSSSCVTEDDEVVVDRYRRVCSRNSVLRNHHTATVDDLTIEEDQHSGVGRVSVPVFSNRYEGLLGWQGIAKR
jgi:hypothetical protein